PLARSITNVISTRFTFNRGTYANSMNVVVYRRPRFSWLFEPAVGSLALQLDGEAGQRYVIEQAATVNAKDWVALTPTNTYQNQPIIVHEPIPGSGKRFYRARMIP